MKAIIIIRASMARADIIIDEIKRQMKDLGWDLPIFSQLEPNRNDPIEDIEIVWIDEDMEREKFLQIIKHQNPLGPPYEIT